MTAASASPSAVVFLRLWRMAVGVVRVQGRRGWDRARWAGRMRPWRREAGGERNGRFSPSVLPKTASNSQTKQPPVRPYPSANSEAMEEAGFLRIIYLPLFLSHEGMEEIKVLELPAIQDLVNGANHEGNNKKAFVNIRGSAGLT